MTDSKSTEVDGGAANKIVVVPAVFGELEIKFPINKNLIECENIATEIVCIDPQFFLQIIPNI